MPICFHVRSSVLVLIMKNSHSRSLFLLKFNFSKAKCRDKNQILFVSLFCLSILFLNSCASLLKPTLKKDLLDVRQGEYVLDAKHSVLLFKVGHLGFSKYVGRFNQFEASLDFNVEDIEKSKLQAIVDMSSIDVNNRDFENTLRGRFWFDTQSYPQAIFTTRSAKKLDSDTLIFQGDLEFLGVTNTIDVVVDFNGAATNILTQKYTLGFEASAQFLRSDFGLDSYIPAVGDEIELEIHAEFQKQ